MQNLTKAFLTSALLSVSVQTTWAVEPQEFMERYLN